MKTMFRLSLTALLSALSLLPSSSFASNRSYWELQNACELKVPRAIERELLKTKEGRRLWQNRYYHIVYKGNESASPEQDRLTYVVTPEDLVFVATVEASCGYLYCACNLLSLEQR